MTELTTPIRGSAARSGWRRLPVLAGAGLLTGLLLTGGTYALWNDDGASPLGQIVAGDLRIELAGETVWKETSEDVRGDEPAEIEPDEFLVRPGDTFTVTQPFTTTLQGDNMLAVLSVDWADDDGAHLPKDVAATYVVLDGDDEPVGDPVDLGEGSVLPALDADDDGRIDDFTLRIDLAFDADGADRFGDDAEEVVADLGTIVLDLDQVRTGEGFQ